MAGPKSNATSQIRDQCNRHIIMVKVILHRDVKSKPSAKLIHGQGQHKAKQLFNSKLIKIICDQAQQD
jgi:hypothetical protein